LQLVVARESGLSPLGSSFLSVFDKLKFMKEEFGLEVTASMFGDALIKKMARTNTLYTESSHQTHIAMTGSEIEMFPYPSNYLYLEQGDSDFKRHYLLKIPVTLLKKNLGYLIENVPSKYKNSSSITRISTKLSSSTEQEIATFTTCVRSKRQGQSDQIELSDLQNDDEWFLNFRRLIFENDYLVFLRMKKRNHYYLLGIKQTDAVQRGLPVGYFYSRDRTVFEPQLLKIKVEEPRTKDDRPLILPSEENIRKAIDAIHEILLIDENTIREVIINLVAGKNVILSGPVGTGKTHLATLIPKLVWAEIGGYYPFIYTATGDWTTQDVIGGILPKLDENKSVVYRIHKGCVFETVSKNWDRDGNFFTRNPYNYPEGTFNGVWLVIDEFNRANIDKAFGGMFTAILYRRLKVPTMEEEKAFDEIPIPKDYRILGTLNTFDKHYLFKLSDALKRRFAFVEVLPPARSLGEEEKYYALKRSIEALSNTVEKEKLEKIKLNHEKKTIQREDVKTKVIEIFDVAYDILAFIRKSKNLGTSTLISIYSYILVDRQTEDADFDKSLDSALRSTVIPQLENVPRWAVETIGAFCSGNIIDFFRSKKATNLTFSKYVEEFAKLLEYLDKDKVLRRLEAYRKDQITTEGWQSYDPWIGKTRPVLTLFKEGLDGLIKELELL